MKLIYINTILVLILALSSFWDASGQGFGFEKTTSFYQRAKVLQNDSIDYGYLKVPENWHAESPDTIALAVAILKNKENKTHAQAVVFVQGGPGASGIQSIGTWYNHPMRQQNDIILVDIRGTGFSKPRLCPDLGKSIMHILAKNQSEKADEKEKVAAAMACRQELISRGVDIDAYNSLSIARDLNALKNQLGYRKWHVYGVSYGTYTAQVYANQFPEDVRSLILDSFITNIEEYYEKNTSNYIRVLTKVFEMCQADPNCSKNYPDLAAIYYKTIADLEKEPITVHVEENVVETGSFTYNSQDFKVAIQQALYKKQLVEVLPVLIYAFKNRNKDALGNLTAAFSSLLRMDYGVYYCVSCNETLPNNQISHYKQDANKIEKLGGGISFYESDFKVCHQWNAGRADSTFIQHQLNNLPQADFPALLFRGEYDPITPGLNAEQFAKKLKKARVVEGLTHGHVPSLTPLGKKVSEAFINNPKKVPDLAIFQQEPKVNFGNGVDINPGISKVGQAFRNFDFLLLSPLLIALTIMLVFIIIYLVRLLFKKYNKLQDKVVRALSILTSLVGIAGFVSLVIALLEVSAQNYFVLAFGLPAQFSYVFDILFIFMVLFLVTFLYFILSVRKINDRSVVFSVLFSNFLCLTYLFYWEVIVL